LSIGRDARIACARRSARLVPFTQKPAVSSGFPRWAVLTWNVPANAPLEAARVGAGVGTARTANPSGERPDSVRTLVTHESVEVRSFREDDLEAIVEFSLRAWAPVFESVRSILGDEIFVRLHPDWQASQAEAVRSSCTSAERDVFIAVADGRPVGFAAVGLNAFHEGMGVIDIIGVDPEYQRRGVATQLTESAIEHMRQRGMDIAVVETGGDPGHAPARAAYDAAGFTLLPIARYFRLIEP
jgi:ribosomal protein S18 acetylase RimI-like enzyme